MSASVRILVADDNEDLRNALCGALEARSGWSVCGCAADGMDAVQKALDLKPDIVLLDLSMPRLNGFEAAGSIHEQIPGTEILIVTEHDAQTLERLPRQPGVRGYIVKSRIDRDLISAVEAASKHRYLSRIAVA